VIVGTLSAPLLAPFCLLSGTVLELAVGSELAGAADQLPARAEPPRRASAGHRVS
jgi:hypothetical protein